MAREQRVVDLVLMDVAPEAYAVRGVLEWFDYRVNLYPIGRPRHLVEVLSGATSTAPHVLLSCHGIEEGIVLPELDPEIAKEEPFTGVLTPAQLAPFVHLPGRVVVSTGCATGSEEFAKAFLDGGCEYYIAPHAYPSGNSVLFFLVYFYYELTRPGRSLEEAYLLARSHDQGTGLFRLYTRQGAL